MMQEGYDARIVEILWPDMIADLHPDMPGLHASREFLTGGVDILQRNLAKRLQPSIAAATKLERSVIKDFRNLQRLLCRPVIRKQHGCGGDHLQVDPLPIQLLNSNRYIPTILVNPPELAVPQHDHAFAAAQLLEPGPVGCAEALGQIGP